MPSRSADAGSTSSALSYLPDGSNDQFGSERAAYSRLIDDIPAILWRANAQTLQFTFVSRYAETLLGYRTQEWAEPSFWTNHLYAEDREYALERRYKAAEDGQPYDIEYRLIAQDGRALWVRELGQRHHCPTDTPELTGVIVDLSKKRSSNKALSESKRWLRQLIDTIPQQIWNVSADGKMDFCNARWRKELGLTLEEVRGDGWHRMLHPEEKVRVLQAWDESVRTGNPYEVRHRHRMADGSFRWFLCRSIPLRDEQGKILRWLGSSTDIQDQKEAEEALRNSEQRWRGVFDNSKVGVALADASLRLVDVNAAFAHMVGYSPDELRGMSFLDFTYHDDRESCKDLIQQVLNGERQHFEMEKRYVRRDGALVWVRINGSLLDSGKSKLCVGLVEDITERKHLADAIQQERDRLRILLDLNRRFASKLDVREFFNALLAAVRELTGWEWATILLPESDSKLRVHLSPENVYLREGLTIPIEGSLQGEVYRSGRPVSFNIEELPELCGVYGTTPWMQEIARAEHVKTGRSLPLVFEGRIIGVLFLMSRNPQPATRSDLNFLQEVAALVSGALHNTLRFEHVNQSHARVLTERNYIEADLLRARGIDGIIGKSQAIVELLREVDAVAPTDSTVLITGETGTGKELVARAIHKRSERRDHSFIKIDCAAIPANLIESELFGHEKGAFTGAITQKLGRFELADKGTLFLDEVGEIPPELQTKLLRVLQDRAFERLGGNRTRDIDVRVIAATNRKLERMVEEGRFREDLYYRLKVFPIDIPPLRDRREDIPPLVHHYLSIYAKQMRKEIHTIPKRAMDVFVRYSWPGNVRELQHFIERSVVLSSGGVLQAPLKELEEIQKRVANKRPVRHRTLEEIERESILQALRDSNWVVGGPNGAAVKLGLKRTTLASRMESLGISRFGERRTNAK
jgi:formate hydrogenlyase transcriptional activator